LAGIGFKFRKLIHEGTYTSEAKGYLFASVFAAGPWIMTMIIIGILTYLAPPKVNNDELIVFRASITYIFAFSLVIVGVFHLPLTRYLADRLFEEDLTAFFSAYLDSLLVIVVLATPAGAAFLYYNSGSVFFKLFTFFNFLVISMIWIGMVFLSAIREYKFVILTFFTGSIASIFFSNILKNDFGLEGYILGFFIGQFVIFTGISAELFKEFNFNKGLSFKFLAYMKKYPLLILSGVGYNLGIWMDKLVIWNSPLKESYYNNLNVYGLYDTAVFIAYLSVIPALGYFYASVETSFYETYRMYFSSIFMKRKMKFLEEARDRIIYMVDASILTLFKNQGVITLLAFVWSAWIVGLFGGTETSVSIFRYALIGVLFQVLFLFCSIFMMYFEFYLELGIINLFFCISNYLGTYIVLYYTEYNLALGYTITCFICFILTFGILRYKLKHLIYLTFINQPIITAVDVKADFSIFDLLNDLNHTPHKELLDSIEHKSNPVETEN